uniref:Bm8914 n=1 Tax=Brugia malayi TaxID=6279 RepID=A0A1I9G0G8_BRUMA|nr:Bm8914 [Brugia malayi]
MVLVIVVVVDGDSDDDNDDDSDDDNDERYLLEGREKERKRNEMSNDYRQNCEKTKRILRKD